MLGLKHVVNACVYSSYRCVISSWNALINCANTPGRSDNGAAGPRPQLQPGAQEDIDGIENEAHPKPRCNTGVNTHGERDLTIWELRGDARKLIKQA